MIAFGTDGWRGVIADDFTFANVALVAQAIADYLTEQGAADCGVVVGYDNRFLAERFAGTVAAVLKGRGIPVLLSEKPRPTPVIAFAVRHYGAAGAVMLTASHNPPEYGGLKFIPDYGGPALPHITRAIEEHLRRRESGESGEVLHPSEPGAGSRGAEVRSIDPDGAYHRHLARLIDFAAVRRAGLKVVVDPLYGAGIGYLETAFGDGVVVEALHARRDPLFGGSLPDPSENHLGELRERVLVTGAHLGLGLDGDADRLGLIDADGTYVSPNQFLALAAFHLYEARGERGPLARTVATTHLVDRIARAYGQEVIETPVGFKYIGRCLLECGAVAGGEESGGFSMRGHIPEKDGILAGLLAAEVVAVHGKSLTSLLEDIMRRFGRVYSERVDIRTAPAAKERVLERLNSLAPASLGGCPVKERVTVDGLKLVRDDGAWVLVRASGTEPVFRVYTEAGTPGDAAAMRREVRAALGL
ncbi:MAG: phosphoglucomutase/phosphomannomutase family protein [Desulfotomaculales bacterium]